MKKLELNGVWKMTGAGMECTGNIPGSVYSFLLDNHMMEDPHYRQNELQALKLMENEFTFSREFHFSPNGEKVLLHCDGLDTLCHIFINEMHVVDTDNMHRTYEFDVTEYLHEGKNEIHIVCEPVNPYIKKKEAEHPLPSTPDPLKGFGHIRKAQCMMGWDWGPRLPDAGIWRDIYLLTKDSARLTEVHIVQRHEKEKVYITPVIKTDQEAEVVVTMIRPDGTQDKLLVNEEIVIENPMLWWPAGLGEQPLYTFIVDVIENGEIVDKCEKRVGLRELKLVQEKDVHGESFCHEVNGIRFFAMGANYIPEDNVFSRITPERTRWLLQQCKDSNFNTIRVWGGGYYPDDFFFDICDELGIMVFFDMMFACTLVWADDEFVKNIRAEFYDNLRRIRHHACLAVISGNNEMEMMFAKQLTPDTRRMYLEIFEGMLREQVKEICPYIPYISSSPTTCGHFIEPNNPNYGESHFWGVWGGDKPFTEYRNRFYRYLSEFGFQSFPSEKTVNTYTIEEDRNLYSRVMELHQRSGAGNARISRYLSETFLYPTNFSTILYASQVLQAEVIRYGVEHFRRHRGRCMGTLYWQLNDIWPGPSWSSIDYFGRYKALQYVAKRFYNPILISCMEIGETTTRPIVNMEPDFYDYETKAQLCITNDTLEDVTGEVFWSLRNSEGQILKSGSSFVTVPSFSAVWLEEMDFEKTDVEHNYLSYVFRVDGNDVSEGMVLFTAPKHFLFRNPNLRYELNGDEITIYADAYAKYVEIDSPDSDFILSDNYFDMNPGRRTLRVLEGQPKTIVLRSVYDIR